MIRPCEAGYTRLSRSDGILCSMQGTPGKLHAGKARMGERAQGRSARPLGCWHHIVTKKQGWKSVPRAGRLVLLGAGTT